MKEENKTTKVEVKVGLFSFIVSLWMTCSLLSFPFLSLAAILFYKDACENLVLRRLEYIIPTRLVACSILKPVE